MTGPPPLLTYRAVELADLAVLAPWLRAAGLGVPTGIDPQAWVQRLRHDPRIVCLTACAASGEVVGCTRLDLGPDRAAEVTVVVAPGLRRRGLGRRLLERALAEARRRGLRRVVALVQVDNRPALAIFRDAGFEESGSRLPGFLHFARVIHRGERLPPLEITP